jgi:protoporphyrinogen oxidase
VTTAIVGGGVSGLTLAHALACRGERVMLFESEPSLGGKIKWRRFKEAG